MDLSRLKPAEGATKKEKRIGRGEGSGRGGTSTRGHKGAQSRAGYSRKRGFEGGQMPLVRRVPKFGFTNPTRVEYKGINLDTLQSLADSQSLRSINPEVLYTNGLIAKNDKLKVLGRGDLKSAIDIEAHAFSANAKSAIEKAGGKALTIARKEDKSDQ